MDYRYAFLAIAGALMAIGCAENTTEGQAGTGATVTGPIQQTPGPGGSGAGTGATFGGRGGTTATPIGGTMAADPMVMMPTAGTSAAGGPAPGGMTGGGASGTPAGGSGGSGTANPNPSGGCLQGGGDYTANGPYDTATMDVEIGSSGPFTIFYPTPLDANCKHPIVAWGNGTGVTGSGTYAFYNEHAASYGIIVAASHNSNTGSGNFHKAGLDWLLAQNEDSGSMFYQKISGRAGTSGHSQGGGGANAGSSHPNVEAIGNVQGAFGRAPAGKAFLCLTGTEDIAIEGCRNSVNGTMSPALYANWEGGTHTGTATIGGFIGGDRGTIQYMRFYTAWFRCFLGDDENACSLFKGGASCPVCMEPGWAEIEARNF
jgi:hypothetical protein